MAASNTCFVEWKEQFESKERGNRVVHYYLKDVAGESILAVVGTERSVRHMFYVVSEEFLSAHGGENSDYAGYRWRSRREVVNWLTSMLSKQHRLGNFTKPPKGDPMSAAQEIHMPVCKGRNSRNLKVHTSGIVWSGESWACGKQLKHYPAFCRNGITIAIQSFVFVMAEEEDQHLAYLEDMYEDKKGQKKVKVRWFHHNQEVKGVISIRNSHPKEVFITPYAQVISVECVDGPAIVVTREHYDKFLTVLPQDVIDRIHLCYRQFKSNRVKPFKLSKLCGYFDQPIFSYLEHAFLEDDEYKPQDNVKVGSKRTRSCRGRELVSYKPSGQNMKYGQRKLIRSRCTILEVSQKKIQVRYDDLKDEDGSGNLEEWIPAFRRAEPDKLGTRHEGRPIIRPAPSHIESHLALVAGAAVDAWWSDGWWEGVLIGISNPEDGILQVFVPSENLFLNVHGKNLRASRDWVGNEWVDVEANGNIVSAISAAIISDAKLSATSTIDEDKSDDFPTLGHMQVIDAEAKIAKEEKLELDGSAPQGSCPENVKVELACSPLENKILEDLGNANAEELQLRGEDKESTINLIKNCSREEHADCTHDRTAETLCDDDNDMLFNKGINENRIELEGSEIAGMKCEPELMEVAA
ncbi:Agenet-like domain-containing protein [Heracleum sosnowskyi]|uniref:Agenet-like domain-containing protein n=1 Tax=Heracleum sosnowskyi TaxID=360622 RepID=A0AAD8JI74_9APIA|nr:Agenet-like domain-containing protein [Heracleum sosnowskyi]